MASAKHLNLYSTVLIPSPTAATEVAVDNGYEDLLSFICVETFTVEKTLRDSDCV